MCSLGIPSWRAQRLSLEGASSTCGGGRTQNVEGAGALLVVTKAMAYLSPHVSRGHLHYLPKLLYWGILTHHKSQPFNASSAVSLITSHSGAATSTVQLWNTVSTTKSVRVPISCQPPIGPAGPGILSSTFCLCRFALWGAFHVNGIIQYVVSCWKFGDRFVCNLFWHFMDNHLERDLILQEWDHIIQTIFYHGLFN